MPKVLGLEKKHWLYIGLAAAAVAAYFLLSRGGGGGAKAPAGVDQGGGIGGPPPSNPGTAYFSPEEKAASNLASDQWLRSQQLTAAFWGATPTGQLTDQGLPILGGATPGAISGAWQQVQGGWSGIKADNQGRFLSEQSAQALGPSNRGPYAHGGTSFVDKALDWAGGIVGGLARNYAPQSFSVGGGRSRVVLGGGGGQIPAGSTAYRETYNATANVQAAKRRRM